MSGEELERELTLCARVSAEMLRGPRGGGRDRDHIVHHTLAAEQDWAKKLGVRTPPDSILTNAGLNAHRNAYCTATRALHAEGKMPARGRCGSWFDTPRFTRSITPGKWKTRI